MQRPLVIGVGGGGGLVISRLASREFDIAAVNPDVHALRATKADIRVQIGRNLCRGLGSGSDPTTGRSCALESEQELKALLRGRPAVAIIAGLGGGTGSGAGPVIAQFATEARAVTVAIVSLPFRFEGRRRMEQAEEAHLQVRRSAGATFALPGDDLLSVLEHKTKLVNAFRLLDAVLAHAAAGFMARVAGQGGWGGPAVADDSGLDTSRAAIFPRVEQWLADLATAPFLDAGRRHTVVVVPDDLQLLQRLACDRSIVRGISPRRFEELIALLYEAAGLRVKLTAASRDHGADLLVWTPGSLFGREFLTVVQVKRFSPGHLVSEASIRDLKGAQLFFDAQRSECITTSDFTRPARQVATTLTVDLAAYEDLCRKINEICGDATKHRRS